jgi:prephenate dehydrogenase
MPRWDTVALVGVGLIGGSIGLALRQRKLARSVIGIGRRPASLRRARERGAVTETTTNLSRGVSKSQLIVICTPVEKIVSHCLETAQHCPPGTLITDVGSTKAGIVARLEGERRNLASRDVRFVGSHPLAGSEKMGPQHARADLFDHRAVVITPSRSTCDSDYRTIEAFWKSLGALVYRKTPAAHDRAVAAISHLPHVVASALAAGTPAADLPLVAGGWLDTTRIAAANVELWRQILVDNRDHVLKSLGKFEKVLTSFRQALEKGDEECILRLLKEGKDQRESVGD